MANASLPGGPPLASPALEDTPWREFALQPLLHRCSPPFFALKTGSCAEQPSHTTSQDHLPESGQKLAYQANRHGVAQRCRDPAVHQSLAGDLARIDHDDGLRRALELSMLNTAQPHDANPLSRRRTVPGLGELVSLVLLDASHDLQRFPRGQDVVSYCRLVKCAKASAGKRSGTSGTKRGHASLSWAFSQAAGLFVRAQPAGQPYLARWENTHRQGKAVTVLAHI
jgi:transposase